MVSFPYYSHTTPIRIPKDMGIVWETYHKGVPILEVPENTLDSNWWEKAGCLNHQLISLQTALSDSSQLEFFLPLGSRGQSRGRKTPPALNAAWNLRDDAHMRVISGGGNSTFFEFSPRKYGERIPILTNIFRRGWLKPPTRSWNATNFWGSGSTYMVIVPYNIGGAIVVARFF